MGALVIGFGIGLLTMIYIVYYIINQQKQKT